MSDTEHEANVIQYALAKQIGRIHTISTDYGDLPLDEDIIEMIEPILRKAYEAKLNYKRLQEQNEDLLGACKEKQEGLLL